MHHEMAPVKATPSSLVSLQWIVDESRIAQERVQEEVEDFTFSVRSQLEWLNDHMAEVLGQGEL
jgi:hypothetical protein